jgi:hypothetical protein
MGHSELCFFGDVSAGISMGIVGGDMMGYGASSCTRPNSCIDVDMLMSLGSCKIMFDC